MYHEPFCYPDGRPGPIAQDVRLGDMPVCGWAPAGAVSIESRIDRPLVGLKIRLLYTPFITAEEVETEGWRHWCGIPGCLGNFSFWVAAGPMFSRCRPWYRRRDV